MKTKMPYEEALQLAEMVKARLAPGCVRIETAGSLRRRKADIGDIELVAIPKVAPLLDMFGQPAGEKSLLDEIISKHYCVIRGDKKYKKLDLKDIECDLFIQPDPATWGANFMIRTGSAEFSKWMVTERQKGGALPGYMKEKDGRLWAGGKALETPEEKDFFRVIGLHWIPPEERNCAYWGEVSRFLERKG